MILLFSMFTGSPPLSDGDIGRITARYDKAFVIYNNNGIEQWKFGQYLLYQFKRCCTKFL